MNLGQLRSRLLYPYHARRHLRPGNALFGTPKWRDLRSQVKPVGPASVLRTRSISFQIRRIRCIGRKKLHDPGVNVWKWWQRVLIRGCGFAIVVVCWGQVRMLSVAIQSSIRPPHLGVGTLGTSSEPACIAFHTPPRLATPIWGLAVFLLPMLASWPAILYSWRRR